MSQEANPPLFVALSAAAAILFLIFGIISGPILKIEWLAITCVIGVCLSLFVVLVWVWGEIIAAIS